jgi:hypothetical protein
MRTQVNPVRQASSDITAIHPSCTVPGRPAGQPKENDHDD